MEFYSLKKPKPSNIDSKKIINTLFQKDGRFLHEFSNKMNSPEYLYWDKIRYKQPAPKGYSREELWMVVKLLRRAISVKTVIKSESGNYFDWVKLNDLEEFYHEIDMNTGGQLFTTKTDFGRITKQKLLTRGVMEEAIASSQLEGASTSRALAKKFLREGRKPQNASEQMILNTYNANKALEEGYKDKMMSLELFYELHGMMTKDTYTPEGEIPRLRKESEAIFVVDKGTGIIFHRAPKISFVMPELERMIDFANDKLNHDFIHPVIKAIMLHFWIAYLHPFTDGNGRLARLIFYWYLLRKGYWAFSYLPISKIIKKAPSQYSMAYVYSENDDYDMTYFIDFNVRKIKLAIKDFYDYLDKKSLSNKKMNKDAHTKYSLNERQIQLLQYLQGDPDQKASIKTHMNIYQTSKLTAINDLKELSSLGFLQRKKIGRNIYYYSTDKIKELFK